jgi:hypothetical protein
MKNNHSARFSICGDGNNHSPCSPPSRWGEFLGWLIIFLLTGLLLSCTDFFSNSLAPWAARSPASVIPAVTTGNVNDLIASAENDPDMSLEVLKKIKDALAGASPEEASSLRAAALAAAANASGFGSAVLNGAGDISKLMENPDNSKGMMVDALNDMSNLGTSSDNLTAILPEPGTADFDAFVEKASADDLAAAAAVLFAAEAKGSSDSDGFINDFDANNPNNSSSAALSVELAKAASRKYDESDSGGRYKDLLSGLNLI